MPAGRCGATFWPSCVGALVSLLLCLLAGCASRYPAGSYGVRTTPRHFYPPPGPPDDPWGPYIREASGRFEVPQLWIRQVMRQESGGREQAISSAGAMGLMQVMPSTYAGLRQRYGLGDDPFEPHDNIMAGTGYIHEMYDRYGSPGFLAAYNAGPNRLDEYLVSGTPLPDETVGYVAAIAPRIGGAGSMTGPLSVYGRGAQYASFPGAPRRTGCDPDAAYDPSRPCIPAVVTASTGMTTALPPPVVHYAAAPPASASSGCDPDAAYDPSRPCAPGSLATFAGATPAAPVVRYAAAPPASASAGCDPDAAYDPSRPCTPTVLATSVSVAPLAPAARYAAVPAPAPRGCDPGAAYDPPQGCPLPAIVASVSPAPVTSAPVSGSRSLLYDPGVASAARPPPSRGRPAVLPPASPPAVGSAVTGDWAIQVGAFLNPELARAAADTARGALPALLAGARLEMPTTEPFGGTRLYRARLAKLTASSARQACTLLAQMAQACVVVAPGHG